MQQDDVQAQAQQQLDSQHRARREDEARAETEAAAAAESNGQPAGPTESSPWMMEAATVEALIEQAARRQAIVASLALGLSVLAIVIALRGRTGLRAPAVAPAVG